MKNLKELNRSKLPIAIYEPKLDKYEKMPLFQQKLDTANAILAMSPPTQFLKNRENKRIKQYFEQGLTIDQMVQNLELTEIEILARLEKMDLVQPHA